jgi:hypothetical protein
MATHHFHPSHYHTAIGSHEPVLRIRDGDTVVTTSILWPRGETKEFIFTVGNARPLDQAVQHATTEMLRWLKEDFGLDETVPACCLGKPSSTISLTCSTRPTPWSAKCPSLSCRRNQTNKLKPEFVACE